jgi:hypothetical protein
MDKVLRIKHLVWISNYVVSTTTLIKITQTIAYMSFESLTYELRVNTMLTMIGRPPRARQKLNGSKLVLYLNVQGEPVFSVMMAGWFCGKSG